MLALLMMMMNKNRGMHAHVVLFSGERYVVTHELIYQTVL